MDRAAFVSKAALRPARLAPTKRVCVGHRPAGADSGTAPWAPAAGREPDPQSSLPEAPYTAMGQQNPGCLESCWGACGKCSSWDRPSWPGPVTVCWGHIGSGCHGLPGMWHPVCCLPGDLGQQVSDGIPVSSPQSRATVLSPLACCREQGGVWVAPPLLATSAGPCGPYPRVLSLQPHCLIAAGWVLHRCSWCLSCVEPSLHSCE